jgi:hypothetical protein
MKSIAEVAQALQTVLTEVAAEAGRQSGFVQRRSKLDGARFVQTLVLGFQATPDATLERLVQMAAMVGVAITPQGLAQRFGAPAACLKTVLAAAVEQLVTAEPQTVAVLQRFSGVYLQDSTTLSLPTALAEMWPGCGGSGSPAALKVQVQWNYLQGELSHLSLQPGRAHDGNAPVQHTPLPTGALRLADLGYFRLDVLAAYSQQGVYWLTRYQVQTLVYDAPGHLLDLQPFLAQQRGERVECAVLLGQQHALTCRLLAVRVPQAVADRRRQRLREQARKRGQTVSARALALAAWTLLLTNAPAQLLTLDEALVLGRTRWQIELLFKRWKSLAGLGHSRSQHPWTILCEVYAKLIGVLLHHWQLLACGWGLPALSYAKAHALLQQHTPLVAHALHALPQLNLALASIQRVLASSCRLNSRRTHPATFQLLLALEPLPICAQEPALAA